MKKAQEWASAVTDKYHNPKYRKQAQQVIQILRDLGYQGDKTADYALGLIVAKGIIPDKYVGKDIYAQAESKHSQAELNADSVIRLHYGNQEERRRALEIVEELRELWKNGSGTAGATLTKLQVKGIIDNLL